MGQSADGVLRSNQVREAAIGLNYYYYY